jgi:phosphatidylglycerol:prolipoprotein diacylglycerol transferase
MAFPKGAPPTLERVHPTQVYEVFAGLLMFAFLNSLKVRLQGRVGALFGLYLILAGIERFIVEYFRTNAPQSWGITMAQTISWA